jgi:hypothetical protein
MGRLVGSVAIAVGLIVAAIVLLLLRPGQPTAVEPIDVTVERPPGTTGVDPPQTTVNQSRPPSLHARPAVTPRRRPARSSPAGARGRG